MSRLKVSAADDPLLGLLGDPNADEAPKKPSPAKAATAAPVESLKTFDTSKVTLKENKPKKEVPKPAEPEDVAAVKPTAEKGLGFATSLWAEDEPKRSSTSNLLDELGVSTNSTIEKDSVFNFTNRPKAGFDASKIAAATDAGKFRLDNDKPDNEDDLAGLHHAGKYLQKEEDLDFETFGKSKVAQGGKVLAENQKKMSKVQKEDFDLASNDLIDSLATATIEKKEKPKPAATLSFLDEPEPSTAAPEPNLDSMDDFASYIATQGGDSGGGGGLFD
jgi:hypothetical protein